MLGLVSRPSWRTSRRFIAVSIRRNDMQSYLADMQSRNLLFNTYPTDICTSFASSVRELPSVMYAGFDPTAESLHIGNLLIFMNLLRGEAHGVKLIGLIGGASAKIGDPSGRSSEREMSNVHVVGYQSKLIRSQLERIANNVLKERDSISFVDNNDWFHNMPMIEYLRLCKQHRVGEMLRMGAVKSRMANDGTLSLTEFCYQTMQAYDWLMLSRTHNCCFQIGGSDQLGHLDLGAHYLKRMDNRFAGGICLPLLTDASGNKLGKSVGGGVWLCADKTSPFHFYQFFRQLHDTEAEKMLVQFSLRSLEELNVVLEEHKGNLGKWIAQDALAQELTLAVHGKEGLDVAQRCSRALFNGSMDDITSLSQQELVNLFGTTIQVPSTIKTFGELANLTRSDKQKGDKLMTKGAFKINGLKMTDPSELIDRTSLLLPKTSNLTLVCWGKRKFSLVEWL